MFNDQETICQVSCLSLAVTMLEAEKTMLSPTDYVLLRIRLYKHIFMKGIRDHGIREIKPYILRHIDSCYAQLKDTLQC